MTWLHTWLQNLKSSIRPIYHFRQDRLWEVDAMRGFAIAIMVVYHTVWDLYGMAGWKIDVYNGFWHGWQLVTATSFISVMGLAMSLRAGRLRARGALTFKPYLWRGVTIFTWGLIVGLVTWFYNPHEFIRFGILHFIGVATVLAYPFLRFRWMNLILGSGLILLPRLLPWRHQLSGLEWLGLVKDVRPTFDYFPLIPWMGVVLLGIFVGNMLYPAGKRAFTLPDWSHFAPVRWLALAGQNSLLIYLIHQPLIILALTLLGIIKL